MKIIITEITKTLDKLEQIEEMTKILLTSDAVTYEPNAHPLDVEGPKKIFYVSENDGHLTINYRELAKSFYEAGYRKHIEAEWFPNPGGGWLCGNCKKYSHGLRNFCPECGAKMKGKR